jgi:hypothetical protein
MPCSLFHLYLFLSLSLSVLHTNLFILWSLFVQFYLYTMDILDSTSVCIAVTEVSHLTYSLDSLTYCTIDYPCDLGTATSNIVRIAVTEIILVI